MVLSTIVTISCAQNLVPGGVSAGADVTLDCSDPCTTLTADFHRSTETNARYTVESLPMDPVGVSLPSSISADDDYSAAIDLGFTFCFFGEQKTQIVIGDNGLISFNVAGYAGSTFAQYTVPANVPSGSLPVDAVFGAYHDLYINEGGEITYGVTGTAPFRAFVINYRNVAQYSAANGCTNPTTQQIVLHETSNFIDVYLTDKPACTGWQDGKAIVGIQLGNGSGGNFSVAPGRNMSDSPWSAIDEAWRFAPEVDGAPTYTFEWINNTTGVVESNNPDYEVCPTETTTYTSHVTWINCVGVTVEASDEVTITVDLPFTLAIDGGNQDFCAGDPAYTINTTTTTTGGITIIGYNWYEAADPSTSLGTGDSLTVSITGTYVVEVTDSGGCVLQQQVDITYNPVPDSGTDGIIDFCSTDTSADLFDSLGGTPDTGGVWSPALTSGTGVFDPLTDTAGPYTYTVASTGSCADAIAIITVTVDIAPNAGTNATFEFCTTDATADLFASLGGTPDTGGVWSPVLTSGTGVFDPAVDSGGAYIYTLIGTGACANVTSQVDVTVYTAPNAGTAVVIADICDTETALDLDTGLTGQDVGGSWTDDDATGGLTGNLFDATGLAAGTYNFTYTVNPTGPCPIADTETVQVTVVRSPTSGTAVSPNLELCNTAVALDLDTSLTGQDTGGSWTDDTGTGGLTGNLFDATGLAAGTYDFTYTVVALGPCPQSQTTVSIEVTAAPNAGTAVVIADICDTETALDLDTGLTGQDVGGSWTDDDATGGLTGNLFDATGLAAGTYNFTYTVNPTGPCPIADTETVQVTVVRSPVAGDDADDFFCMTDVSRDLFNTLGGIPDTGGAWSPVLTSSTGEFNPAVDPAGVYTYTVFGLGACVDDTATVTVTLSEAPIITSIDIVDFSENNTITISVQGIVSATLFGIGDYEYSIDGVSFQSENIFENVAPGTYTVTVRDANGCMPDTEVTNVSVMGAPKFFTPNFDGKNDTWQIVNIQSQPNAQISIYDRFGKIIIQFDGTSQGWDGMYNNHKLSSNDYWFSVIMNDVAGNPVIRRGHFSLVRR